MGIDSISENYWAKASAKYKVNGWKYVYTQLVIANIEGLGLHNSTVYYGSF